MGDGTGVSATRYLHARVCESSTPPQNILPPTRTHTAGSSTERKLTKLFKTMIKKGGLITMFRCRPSELPGRFMIIGPAKWTGDARSYHCSKDQPKRTGWWRRTRANSNVRTCTHTHTLSHSAAAHALTHPPYRVLYDIVNPPTARARARVCEHLMTHTHTRG